MADDFQNLSNGIASNLTENISGIFSVKPSAKFASGARCNIKINGRTMAFATAITWNIGTVHTEIRTIDDYLPYELVPQVITVDGTIGGLHVPGFGASAELIQSNVLSFLFHRYVTIEVRDNATNTLLFYAGKAAITSRSESFAAENLAQVSLSFKAVGWRDEASPEFPSGFDGSQV